MLLESCQVLWLDFIFPWVVEWKWQGRNKKNVEGISQSPSACMWLRWKFYSHYIHNVQTTVEQQKNGARFLSLSVQVKLNELKLICGVAHKRISTWISFQRFFFDITEGWNRNFFLTHAVIRSNKFAWMWDMVGVASKATAYKQSTKAPEHRKKERESKNSTHSHWHWWWSDVFMHETV